MENVKGERREPEMLGEVCATCGRQVWLDAHVLFQYSALALIYDRTQGKCLDVDVAQPKLAGGSLTICYNCSTSGVNPFIDAALLRRIVEAAKTFEKENTPDRKSLWQKARGIAARILPN